MKNTLFLPLLLLLISCGTEPVAEDTVEAPIAETGFYTPIEEAHRLDKWQRKPALQGRIFVGTGEKTRMDVSFLMTPDQGKVRMETADGTLLIWDGSDAWVSPAESEYKRPRFDLLTWTYFLTAAFKLNDPGTIWSDEQLRSLKEDMPMESARLSFEAGTGDSPDDWYYVYRYPESNLLAALGYIVTYGGKTAEKAAENPHAIWYEQYQVIDGVVLPEAWSHWEWTPEGGLSKKLSDGRAGMLRFVEYDPEAFAIPEGARKVIKN